MEPEAQLREGAPIRGPDRHRREPLDSKLSTPFRYHMFLKKDQAPAPDTKRLAAMRPLDSQFDAFLYAPLFESSSEIPVSVLSALARQNVDPWTEAAVLARLPRTTAITKLTALIASISAADPGRRDPADNAARLAALLPRPTLLDIPHLGVAANGVPRRIPPLLIYLIIGAAIAAALLLGN
jgi:hypothetical protein